MSSPFRSIFLVLLFLSMFEDLFERGRDAQPAHLLIILKVLAFVAQSMLDAQVLVSFEIEFLF
jgi:hypothetical protein